MDNGNPIWTGRKFEFEVCHRPCHRGTASGAGLRLPSKRCNHDSCSHRTAYGYAYAYNHCYPHPNGDTLTYVPSDAISGGHASATYANALSDILTNTGFVHPNSHAYGNTCFHTYIHTQTRWH